jgi:putative transposase
MSNYRRNRVPGGTYFFTVNLLDRRSDLFVTNIEALRAAVRRVRASAPFHIDAWVVLRLARGERGVWQRRFWEHTIRDDRDYAACRDYAHFNPVKHGLVNAVLGLALFDFPPLRCQGALSRGLARRQSGTAATGRAPMKVPGMGADWRNALRFSALRLLTNFRIERIFP